MPGSRATAPLEVRVEDIRKLSRAGRHGDALAAAEALMAEAPRNREALYLIAANQRCLNRIPEALAALQRLEQEHPEFSLLYQERGHCFTRMRDASRAIEAFLRAVALNPALAASWQMLERLYRMTGDDARAATAAEQVSRLRQLPPEIARAGSLFSDGNSSAAESILRAYIARAGDHVEALRLLGRIEHQQGVLDHAETLLEGALRLSPDYRAARLDYLRVLVDRQKYARAHEILDNLVRLEPTNTSYLSLHAAACAGLGQHEDAIRAYRQLLTALPESCPLLIALGHSLQSIGQRNDAIESYKRAASLKSGFGDAWWSLANLKTYSFSDEEIAHMRREEADLGTPENDRCHLCFALGKAFEDRQGYAESWQFYERGNSLRRAECHYRPEIIESEAETQIATCTARFFAARAGSGAPDAAPIFVVGLPRSGSTLVEQILASHGKVEGTRELPEMPRIVSELKYPHALSELGQADFRRLGERYIAETRAYRTNKPLFTDKMPNNFRHVGLIHLILPNAKIIDVRREPMACCFANLKQLFASGQEFTYSMEDVGRYYRTYLDLMRHWDSVLPGRVLRVWYEDVVNDLEGNVQRILKYCGLDFEPACLEFYNSDRSVSTPSSEQVRQRVFREGLGQWRNYERWLNPLKDALGDAVVRYRDAQFSKAQEPKDPYR
ncbi:MAG TPA: sulfotransferase [Bryobacteraceae bacterium]|jgi:predicted Zn-dependent protease|nr:sulfotransferase [Bryobacteraceae bacterium]